MQVGCAFADADVRVTRVSYSSDTNTRNRNRNYPFLRSIQTRESFRKAYSVAALFQHLWRRTVKVRSESIPMRPTGPLSLASINYTNFSYQASSFNGDLKKDSLSYTLRTLCPYAGRNGLCDALATGRSCPYLHGDVCDLCQMPALDPNDERQREQHRSVSDERSTREEPFLSSSSSSSNRNA